MKKTIFLFIFCINLWPTVKLGKVYYESFSFAIAQIQSSKNMHECEGPILDPIYTTLDCVDIGTEPKTTCEICGNIYYRNQECPNMALYGLCNTKHHAQEDRPNVENGKGATSESSNSDDSLIKRWQCSKCNWKWDSNSCTAICPSCGSWACYILY